MRNMKMPARAAALNISALAMSAMFASPGASAANGSSDTDIPAGMRFALQRDLGMMPGQIPQYLDAERLSTHVERDARARLGDHYAGTWLERDAQGRFRIVVAATRPNVVSVRGIVQSTRLVEHSLRTLEGAYARLDGTARNIMRTTKTGGLDARIQSWHIDPSSNRIVVSTDIGAGHIAGDFVAAADVDARMVTLVESAARPRPTAFDIRGGDGYTTVSIGVCSIGFAVTLGASNGFVTAGHCGPTGASVVDADWQAIGYIAQSVFPGSDYAVVHNTNAQGVPRPWVNAYSFGGNLSVRGSTPAVKGAVICRSGATTGARCGTVDSTAYTANYQAGLVSDLTVTTACIGGGDSGGSFVTPDGQAQGVASGGNVLSGSIDNCAANAPYSYFQKLGPILSAHPGLTLVTTP